jgi:dipeptidyl aminopeptidase/acylaminoacyl peptidase
MSKAPQLLLLVCIAVHCASAAPVNAAVDSALDRLYATRHVRQVAIAPDAKQVAWVEPVQGRALGATAIMVAPLPASAGAPRRVTAGDGRSYAESEIAWSPDSKELAFISDAAGTAQLYVANANGGKARKLTNVTGFLTGPGWSPDGKQIAFLFTENAPREAGPLAPMTPETGEVESRVYEQRLTTVNVSSGEMRQLSPPQMYVYEYDWAPDGKQLAITAAPGAGDANWYVAQLYTLSSTGEMKNVYRPPLQMAVPRWSPDGKSLAFIGGLMSDEGSTGGDIYVVPSTGGEARDVTPNIKASPSWISWTDPSRIIFAADIDGAAGIGTLEVASGRTESLWSGPESISTDAWGAFAVSLASDHKTSALVRQSFSQAPEVWAGPIGGWQQVTHLNTSLRPTWGKVESLHWTNDGMGVQGWLMYPRDYDPQKRYPLVVEVHGGPGYAATPAWPEAFLDTSVLSGLGMFVLYPNPRGSFGAGEAFTRANIKDFGYGDFRDILAGVDYAEKHFGVDPNRLGVTGWSYGGYMTMWAVTQTNRFHAAVAGAGIADYLSYYGQNDIDTWMLPFFGAPVYDDPAVYARSSPITYIKNVKTPTLVLVGERDGECPAPQSREFWHALKSLGVPTQLVIYPGEGHFIALQQDQRDIVQRMVTWFEKYLK